MLLNDKNEVLNKLFLMIVYDTLPGIVYDKITSMMEIDFKKIVHSGQCFRAQDLGDKFRFVSKDKILYIKQGEDIADSFWRNYFDLDKNYNIDVEGEFLSKAKAYSQGIRILKQDPFETLISFIISQRRSIPAIRTCVERICETCGVEQDGVYLFPTPKDLANADISDCGLGYRHDYVKNAAKLVSYGDIDLEAFRKLSTEDLMYELTSIRGVGEKVANCVALFGYHKIEAFPVDVWISRVQDRYYNGRFPVEKYPGFAGVLQQYIFYFIRKN